MPNKQFKYSGTYKDFINRVYTKGVFNIDYVSSLKVPLRVLRKKGLITSSGRIKKV